VVHGPTSSVLAAVSVTIPDNPSKLATRWFESDDSPFTNFRRVRGESSFSPSFCPLIVCDLTPLVIQITPMEWGSWDPQLSAMMNMSYAGTHLTNGQPDNDTACVTGFDDTGFMMGTSASLFNVSPFIDGSILMAILVHAYDVSNLSIGSTIPFKA
jgi:Lysophospholipase catalytic domain